MIRFIKSSLKIRDGGLPVKRITCESISKESKGISSQDEAQAEEVIPLHEKAIPQAYDGVCRVLETGHTNSYRCWP